MSAVNIQVSGVKDVTKFISNFQTKLVNGQRKLNKTRAVHFREKTIEYVKNDQLGLAQLQPSTIANRVMNLGGPMYDTGELVKGQEIISKKDGSAECGYFRTKTKQHSLAKMTNWKLAVIHHTGATFKDGRILPARPFMFASANKYQTTNDDIDIAVKFVRDNVQ